MILTRSLCISDLSFCNDTSHISYYSAYSSTMYTYNSCSLNVCVTLLIMISILDVSYEMCMLILLCKLV